LVRRGHNNSPWKNFSGRVWMGEKMNRNMRGVVGFPGEGTYEEIRKVPE
jgi:hypothetical protein